ncbi:CobW family GTP-binding protein [Desulforamulus ruminis]|uniref:Cobalamin synthesis protein P47K n=1 Tax=Desulforamulus ruminis (strain ATCC 23193 / DSM 2154 / NCIMB 8452 / DL) TaxID=696281 RepID=F6DKX0_DESRL|nr:GTP-binding protein [Desulforamulus ruminis]AEG61602.1 cobalamin synthesis protein P47K [Desulforamulus ruminis DSM 2154]
MRVPVDIISGFLGAGKTTLISKLLDECYQEQRVFLLENEYGEVGIDGSLLANQKVEVKEIYSGCICCSLKGDFTQVLLEALDKVKPQRIIIEPTGVGKLSEILSVLEQDVFQQRLTAEHIITVVDALKAEIYLRNFGEFFKDQVKHARTLVLSKNDALTGDQVRELMQMLRPINPTAAWVTTPWENLKGKQILEVTHSPEVMFTREFPSLKISLGSQHSCGCGCHHSGEHRQHHECNCHSGKHPHHLHAAPEVFQGWSWESPKAFSNESLQRVLTLLGKDSQLGYVLRAKGIVPGEDQWLHFEYVTGDWKITAASPQPIGRAVVIGQNLKTDRLNHLFEKCVEIGC